MVRLTMTNDEAIFITAIRSQPMTLRQMQKKGFAIGKDKCTDILMTLDNKGFLLYEEPVRPGSRVSRYGLMGVARGSFAENWIKENMK